MVISKADFLIDLTYLFLGENLPFVCHFGSGFFHSNEWVNQIFLDVHTNTAERGWHSLKSSIYATKRSLISGRYLNNFMIFNNTRLEHVYEVFTCMSILNYYLNN